MHSNNNYDNSIPRDPRGGPARARGGTRHVTSCLIAFQEHTKTVQESPDPSFRVLVMQYIQRCANGRGLDARLRQTHKRTERLYTVTLAHAPRVKNY